VQVNSPFATALPEHPSDPPIVLAVEPWQYESVSGALAAVGRQLHRIPPESEARTALHEQA
jgi:hypothetical protein